MCEHNWPSPSHCNLCKPEIERDFARNWNISKPQNQKDQLTNRLNIVINELKNILEILKSD